MDNTMAPTLSLGDTPISDAFNQLYTPSTPQTLPGHEVDQSISPISDVRDQGSDQPCVCDCDSSVDEDREIFGPLLDITDESLITLAKRIAGSTLHMTPNKGEVINRISGTYNIIHIVGVTNLDASVTKLVIRVACTSWNSGHTPIVVDSMKSQVATMRLIREKTAFPVPEVYHLDVTSDNEISAPYVCMSFVPGKRVSNVWHSRPGVPNASLQLLRRNILVSVAKAMAELSALSFDSLGSIQGGEAMSGSPLIGPIYQYRELPDSSQVYLNAYGPFKSGYAWLQDGFAESREEEFQLRGDKLDEFDVGVDKVIDILLRRISAIDSLVNTEGYVLAPPDLDSQNVMVDKTGNVTGFIDWDGAHTLPRWIGYAAYPRWIVRDWDPVYWGFKEDRSDPFSQHRAYYNAQLGAALGKKGDWKWSERANLFQALEGAAFDRRSRSEICAKFAQLLLHNERLDNPRGDLFDVGNGAYNDEELAEVEKGLVEIMY